nr:MAG TPA: hypothetical protein [Crassvirales sp.]
MAILHSHRHLGLQDLMLLMTMIRHSIMSQ